MERQINLMIEQKKLFEQIYRPQSGGNKIITDSKEEIERKAKLYDDSRNK